VTPPTKLDESRVTLRLRELAGWELRAGKIRRTFKFRDFVDAFAFMTRVAFLAERLGHHPDWSNGYSSVTIDLWTHDAGGITEVDLEFAAAVSKLVDAR
jgi:4a-hydroxytetrahydrobiopterin dehydratase